nr:MAG TPA: hypothetical protein [Caudoviricetes sp.]
MASTAASLMSCSVLLFYTGFLDIKGYAISSILLCISFNSILKSSSLSEYI